MSFLVPSEDNAFDNGKQKATTNTTRPVVAIRFTLE